MNIYRNLFLVFALASLFGCVRSVSTSAMPTIEEGKPTGTVYVGYVKKLLPSGTRQVIFDDQAIFSINGGEFSKFKVSPGEHTVRMECVSIGGWSDRNSKYNTSFTIKPDQDVYFMIGFDRKCKRPQKNDILQVTDLSKQELIKSYKDLNFQQKFTKKSNFVPTVLGPCCEINGKYTRQKPLYGEVTITQSGSELVMLGRDLLTLSFSQIMATAGKPHTPGSEIKIVAKLNGKDIVGEWWYMTEPDKKKPFNATVGKHAGRKDMVIYTGGDMSGVLYKSK